MSYFTINFAFTSKTFLVLNGSTQQHTGKKKLSEFYSKVTPSCITFFEHNPNFVQFWSETNINVFKEQHLWPHFRIHNAAFVQDDSFAFLTRILKARPCPFIQILSKTYPDKIRIKSG